MKVVFVNPVGLLGGAERSLLDLIASLRETDRWDPYLVVSTEGPLIERAEKLDIPVSLVPMPQAMVEIGDTAFEAEGAWGWTLHHVRRTLPASVGVGRYISRLRSRLRELNPDLIHSNGIKSHMLSRTLQVGGCPIVWHVRDFVSLRPVMRRLLGWASHTVGGAIAISNAVAEDARQVFPNLPIDVVYNAIDTDYFSPGESMGTRLDELAGMPAATDVVRVGLVSTFARWKGHDLFLRAVDRLLRSHPEIDARFYMIGGPIYHTEGSQVTEGELRATARNLGLNDRVGFIGFQEDVAEIFRSLDVVVHASTRPEPFGRTIVEAMACAKPVIVAPTGGAQELFTHEHDAIGFRPGDADDLAAGIARLVGDADLRSRIGACGRQTALTRFSRSRLGNEVSEIYDRLARKRSSSPA